MVKAENDPLDKRLRDLEDRLDKHPSGKQHKAADEGPKTGFGNALKLSSEFVAAILVGAGLGWFFDQFAGTSPWGMIIFLLLGFAAGVKNVMRAAGTLTEPDKK